MISFITSQYTDYHRPLFTRRGTCSIGFLVALKHMVLTPVSATWVYLDLVMRKPGLSSAQAFGCICKTYPSTVILSRLLLSARAER